MAGFCRKIKAGAKRIRKQITKDVLTYGLDVMMGFAPSIADGTISKKSAGVVAADMLVNVKRIGISAATAAITILAEAMKAEIEDPNTMAGDQLFAGAAVMADMLDSGDDLPPGIDAALDADE